MFPRYFQICFNHCVTEYLAFYQETNTIFFFLRQQFYLILILEVKSSLFSSLWVEVSMVVLVWSVSEDLRQQKEKLVNSSKTPCWDTHAVSLFHHQPSTWTFIYKHISTYICVCLCACLYAYLHVVCLNVLGTILVQEDAIMRYQSSSTLATQAHVISWIYVVICSETSGI